MKYFLKVLILTCLVFQASCNSDKSNLYGNHDESTKFLTVENKNLDIKSYLGKYLIVNYWATWCSPCVKELPELVKYNEDYANKARVVGVNLEENNTELNNYIKKFKINYPNFKKDFVYQLLGLEVVGYPTTYVFAPNGTLVKTIQGPVSIQILNQYIK